ncbi:interferon regulatory factor 1-like [Pecten maximus]|uniref:interferon regulatory factor 1-like n=1 Tax=Pecten maximus TaxID=6579 RepID=UPI0014589740|nr:interferon regulatory factor 1-like [Pecten maximus]XP_033744719.1 interferon regulatory factor 1-like [Pecten maximus]
MTKSDLQANKRGRRPVERQKMRPWLIELLNNNKTDGLTWEDREQGTFRINWKHGARNGWNIDKDANVFEQYAIHTGRYTKDQNPNPKRWKANFRCALNSLGDVKEIKTEGTTRGNNAYRLFEFLEEKRKTIKRSRQQSVDSDEDSGVESPTSPKKPQGSYSLRSRRRKKHFVKKEIESSDSSDAAVDSPNVQPDVKDVSLPVPSKDTDAAIEARVKTEYADEELGIISGTLPNHYCGFVMIRYGEKMAPSESKDDIGVTVYDKQNESSDDSDSDEESNDTALPSLFNSNPYTPSTSRQISVPEYSNLITTPECHMSDLNVMSQTIDYQGNLVIAAQVEIPGELSDQNPSQTTQLPVPVRDLMYQQSGYISQP